MSNDDQADSHKTSRDKDDPKHDSKHKPKHIVHIDDIKAEVRKKTQTAAEAEGMSIEKYEQVEKAIEEGRDGDYTDEEREAVEKIQESFDAETLAQFQRVILKPWLQTYVANDMFESQTSSIVQNFKKNFAPQKSWNTIQSSFASNFSKNLPAGVAFSAETLRAIRNFTAPNQEFLKSTPSLMHTFDRMRETLQGYARAAQIAGFATNTQEFLTTDAALRYRWNRPVWHYTNGHALLSIIRNGKLWASSPENLNDSSEMTHGFDVITEAFRNKMEEAKNDPDYDPDKRSTVETVLSEVLNKGYFDSIINDVYYISASAEHDSLTLWRNYADGDGFAIGIDTTVELSAEGNAVDEAKDGEHIRADVPLISGWYRVSYKKREKQKLAQEFIKSAIADIGKTAVRDRSDLEQELRKQAIILASVMKHEAFKDEREVRWITTNFTTFDSVHYEHGRRSIVPVLHVMTSSAEGDQPLPLKGLRCSPIPNDSIVRTMQGMLKQGGYIQASSNVRKSQQPFKG
ncbi:DUF2971 domain-containing protein [Glutamicibacter sp. JC586]|uniref:DUF2971 domain-containing protein n=1 Tax=Glutamicibacter sp. JC586 TaxID=2590552 RepID=UPI00135C69D4|nr:DUF2971 domain-containing protein [Glutamicibacter sp. JC586]